MTATGLSTAFQRLWEAYEHFYYAEHLLNEARCDPSIYRDLHARALGDMAVEQLIYSMEATMEMPPAQRAALGKCRGCGCPQDDRTVGCATCTYRYERRARVLRGTFPDLLGGAGDVPQSTRFVVKELTGWTGSAGKKGLTCIVQDVAYNYRVCGMFATEDREWGYSFSERQKQELIRHKARVLAADLDAAVTSVDARSRSLGNAADVAPVLPRGLRSVAGV